MVTTQETTMAADRHERGTVSVEILYFEDCPGHEPAMRMLQDVLGQEHIPVDISVRRIDSEEEARALNFPGSPTIRIAGKDIDGHPGLAVGLSCRTYVQTDGTIGACPPREKLVRAIRAAASQL